jgi:hypothetical protein
MPAFKHLTPALRIRLSARRCNGSDTVFQSDIRNFIVPLGTVRTLQ